ncbi:MAG: DUF2807 domain-containing protein [Flammeovirgaceae bacterium]|nr:DUF2807 domain-containing protein [Flammeovirgaceae bacterium]
MKSIFAVLLLFTGFISVQGQTRINLENYTSIDAFGAVSLELIRSDKPYIIIDYNNVDKEDMVAEVANGTLKLKIKNRHYMDDWSNNKHKKTEYVRVKVYYVSLDEIEGHAGAKITSSQPIISKRMSVDCSMGSEIDLIVVAEHTKIHTSMGSELTLNGKTDHLDIRSSMGANIQAENFKAQTVDISASMGAIVRVHVEKELDVSTSLGAEIFYSGDPDKRHVSKNLGGEVKNH